MVGEMPSGSLMRSALPSPGHGSRGPVAHRTVMNAERPAVRAKGTFYAKLCFRGSWFKGN